MLTDLNWLNRGEFFPPASEAERLNTYEANRILFESGHDKIYAEQFKRIERLIGNFQDVVSYPVIVNFQKLMSLKVADLLLGEPPDISCDDQDTLELILSESDLINTAYMVAIDVSRYGSGLFYSRKKAEMPIVDITVPSVWFPVVNPRNIRDVKYHVLAYDTGGELDVEIHSVGSYEIRRYELSDNGMIGDYIEPPTVIKTGLDNFAITVAPNVLTSDRVTGLDDYTDLDSILSDLMVRIGQIDRILDKHANPSMQGPITALERDVNTGEYRVKIGNYFPRENKEDPEAAYLTWDGQLEANFRQVDRLINLLYTISEMGSALMGDVSTGSTGAVVSGSALRRLMISPLAKVNRIRMRFDEALKESIRLTGLLHGKKLGDITITWHDGLPGDPVEEAEIMKSRTAGKATMSQRRALELYDAMTEEKAEEEIARIQADEASLNPMTLPPIEFDEVDDDGEIAEAVSGTDEDV